MWWRQVSPITLRADLIAGLLGAVLVLPQGIAFATLAGLPAQYGLYTAIVPCIVAALAGSSRHVMSGPTNANSLALFAMLSTIAVAGSPNYIALALTVTIMVGIAELAVGALRLGTLADFISPSVLLGFTCGAATLIALYALKDVCGLYVPAGNPPAGPLRYLLQHVREADVWSLAVAAATLAAALLTRRINRKLPYLLIGLVAGYLAALVCGRLGPAAGAHIRVVGVIPSPIPSPHWPAVEWGRVSELIGMASALTIVSLAQSISIAKAIALRSGQRIDANREFIGQGLSNVVGGFFSCFISCGSLNRSMPNYESGARTPLAAVFSALLLLMLVWLSAPLLGQIPMAAIAAVLLLVAWSLFDFGRLRRIYDISRIEFVIAIGTFVATLVIRLELAILLGTAFSLIAYLYRTAHPSVRPLVPDRDDPGRRFTPLDELATPQPECPQFKLVRMEGAIFFGAVPHVSERLHRFRVERPEQKRLLVMTKSMNFIDLAGAEMWEAELADRREMGGDLYFHRPRTQVLGIWKQVGFTERLGAGQIFSTKRVALGTIIAQLDPAICARCTVRIFDECKSMPGP